jgi:organic radical activating enzyme
MLQLDYVEFYITNVCNLNCPLCQRFNNYNFKGHQKWADFKQIYAEWAKVINVKTISIIGGEPLLNPDFQDWLLGIRALWPNARIEIATNGTQLHKWSELYHIVKSDTNIHIRISLHGGKSEQMVQQSVSKFYNNAQLVPVWEYEWVNTWNVIKADNWPNCNSSNDFYQLSEDIKSECSLNYNLDPANWRKTFIDHEYTDQAGVKILYIKEDIFFERTIIVNSADRKITLQNSKPEEAIKVCGFAINKCSQFVAGKLYKCHAVALLPEFIKQFPVTVSDDDLSLLSSYKPANYNWHADELKQFIEDIDNRKVIPQCKFCPADLNPTKITSSSKKIPIFSI